MSVLSISSAVLPAIYTSRSMKPQFRLLKVIRSSLEEIARVENLPEKRVNAIWYNLKALLLAVRKTIKGMNSDKRLALISFFSGESVNDPQFNLTWGLPDLGKILSRFPHQWPVPPIVKLPPIPPLELELPAINVDALCVTIEEKIGGFLGGVFQSVKEVLINLPVQLLHALSSFFDRLTTFGEVVKNGEVSKAVAELFAAFAFLIVDVSFVVVAALGNLFIDVCAGTIGSFFHSRPVNATEVNIAHGIFGYKINMTNVMVSVVPLNWVTGMVAANTIFLNNDDYTIQSNKNTLAHELTHIYQDQHILSDSTLVATYEHINHFISQGSNIYEVKLNEITEWNVLGVEQQGQLIQNWQDWVDTQQYSTDGGVTSSNKQHYERILMNQGFFQWQ